MCNLDATILLSGLFLQHPKRLGTCVVPCYKGVRRQHRRDVTIELFREIGLDHKISEVGSALESGSGVRAFGFTGYATFYVMLAKQLQDAK